MALKLSFSNAFCNDLLNKNIFAILFLTKIRVAIFDRGKEFVISSSTKNIPKSFNFRIMKFEKCTRICILRFAEQIKLAHDVMSDKENISYVPSLQS